MDNQKNQVYELLFYYSSNCEFCGSIIELSYFDKYLCFSGELPGRALMTGSLLCACQYGSENISITDILPYTH